MTTEEKLIKAIVVAEELRKKNHVLRQKLNMSVDSIRVSGGKDILIEAFSAYRERINNTKGIKSYGPLRGCITTAEREFLSIVNQEMK